MRIFQDSLPLNAQPPRSRVCFFPSPTAVNGRKIPSGAKRGVVHPGFCRIRTQSAEMGGPRCRRDDDGFSGADPVWSTNVVVLEGLDPTVWINPTGRGCGVDIHNPRIGVLQPDNQRQVHVRRHTVHFDWRDEGIPGIVSGAARFRRCYPCRSSATVRANSARKVAEWNVRKRRGGASETLDYCPETERTGPAPIPHFRDWNRAMGVPATCELLFSTDIESPIGGATTSSHFRHSHSLVSVPLSAKKTRSVENRSILTMW